MNIKYANLCISYIAGRFYIKSRRFYIEILIFETILQIVSFKTNFYMKSTIKIRFILILIFLVYIKDSKASVGENYIYTILPTKDLYIPNANCIYKEKNKYVWIGTNNGIYRFDGIEYKHYPILKNQEKINCFIIGLFVDKNNCLWFVSNKDVGRYNSKEDKLYIEPLPENFSSYTHIYCYSKEDDGIYFGGADCIFKFDYKTEKIDLIHKFNFNSPFPVWFLKKTTNNNIILSDRNEIIQLNVISKRITKDFIYLPSKASCFYCDHDMNIWIATFNNGLICFDINGKVKNIFNKETSKLSSEVILCIEEKDSLLWMGTDGGGINILNKKDNSIRVLEHITGNNNSLPSNSIKSIHIDSYNMVWAGSVRDGIINIQRSFMNTYQEVSLGSKYGLSNSSVISLFQEKNNDDLWIATDGEGINRFDFDKRTFNHYPSTFRKKIVSIASYSENELLLSTYLKGFFIFNKNTGSLRSFNVNNEHIIKRAFFSETTVVLQNELSNNILFMSDIMFRYNTKTNSFKEIKIGFKENHFGYFLVAGKDDKNTYFFDDCAIYSLENNTDSLIRIFHIPEEDIKSATLDNKNCIWLATNKGLSKINIEQGKREIINNGTLNNISSIESDNKGTIWIGMENKLYAYIQNGKSFALFGDSQGAKKNEYLQGSSILANNGSICMGGSKGLLIIDEHFKFDAVEIPEVKMVEVKIDGVQRIPDGDNLNKNITMHWGDKSLEISVMSLERDMLRPKNFRFEIVGSNPMVINSSTHVLKLNSLLPGNNSIYVSCNTRKGLWTKPVEILTVNVLPPWYRTWWFIISCALMFSIIIVSTFLSILMKKENAMKMALKEHEKNVYEEKVRFLINMSHELRTPLTLIHAPLKRILKKMNANDINFIPLSKIYRQSGRMKKLLNMVLDLRKMEMGERTVHFDEYNLNEWIVSVVNDFVSEGEAMGVNIYTKLDKNIDKVVFDKEKMEIILTNLLVNAMKHSENNSEVIIKSELINESKDIKISIIDRGPGLEGVEPEKLFTRFYQGSNEKYGTGIGLSYSKILVELHNGVIGAMNNTGDPGATFFFSFPSYLESTDVKYDSKPYLNEILESDSKSNMFPEINNCEYSTINDVLLLVDDSNELLEFVSEALGNNFKTIQTASNGKDALNIIERNIPNIIVSDVMMPEMNGYELCYKIKSNPNLNHIPIILLTARDEDKSSELGYEVGANTYITKPFEIETLLKVIKGLLNNREQTKQHYMNLSVIPDIDKMDINNTNERFLQKLNSIIKENISNSELDINFICSSIGMSRASFYNKLKSVTDISANDYINKVRLEYAKSLIISTNMSFIEISFKSGFTSSNYFSRLFKQYTGMTPTQFRNKEPIN